MNTASVSVQIQFKLYNSNLYFKGSDYIIWNVSAYAQ